MARLLVTTDGFSNQVLELRLGVNRLGRSSDNDLQLEHPTISALHCELLVEDGQLLVRDCASTNGTFVSGEVIHEARLSPGQSFRVGDVELLVDSTEMSVAIPKFSVAPETSPPVVLSDGTVLCSRHPEAQVTHQCTYCREFMCDGCVRRLRRRGGKTLKLCVLCSHAVEPIGGQRKKKRSLLSLLQQTVKLPFLHHEAKGSKEVEVDR